MKTLKTWEQHLTVQNCIHEEIKSRLNLGNACCHSVESLFFSFCLLSRDIQFKIYKTIILPVVLYECETWSLTLRVFENRVLWRIFGPKRYEVAGEWRKLHSEELHNLYLSPYIIMQIKSRWMRWAGHVAHMGEERKVYKVLVAKPKGKRPLRRPRHR
jgi:hypothetical protein